MQGSSERLAQMLSTPEGQKSFLDWLSSPLTQELLSYGEDSVTPVDVTTITAEQALFQLGIVVGGRRVLDRIRNPMFAQDLRNMVRKLEDAPAYGSDKILAKEGR